MSRRISWRKSPDADIWRAKVPQHYKVECRLVLHAGVVNSSVMNRNARLEVQVPTTGRNYKTVIIVEFYSSWWAKEYVDSLLQVMYFYDFDSKDHAFQWFIDILSKVQKIDQPETSEGSWTSLTGWSR